MVDNLEIETPGPLPSGIRNIMPQLLNDANSLSRPSPAEEGLTVYKVILLEPWNPWPLQVIVPYKLKYASKTLLTDSEIGCREPSIRTGIRSSYRVLITMEIGAKE